MTEYDVDTMRRALLMAADSFEVQKDYLGQLDAAVGDGDHGASMARGFRAVAEQLAVDESSSIGALWQSVGKTLVSVVGGATGPLFGTFFLRGGTIAAEKTTVGVEDLAGMFEEGLAGIRSLGGAQVGDKTLVDALVPAAVALRVASDAGDLGQALRAAATAAEDGAAATRDMIAKKGRARYQGERSRGHQDAGATSVALLVGALADGVPRVGTST